MDAQEGGVGFSKPVFGGEEQEKEKDRGRKGGGSLELEPNLEKNGTYSYYCKTQEKTAGVEQGGKERLPRVLDFLIVTDVLCNLSSSTTSRDPQLFFIFRFLFITTLTKNIMASQWGIMEAE
ncbi:hypothetical protein NE237_023796 [Protea cynaroides]|uniref:Uncharacterized protein n=1 Tax=Protea cynaroides TaxID=273540 RepID=A0A9Q0K5R1_9MAGN|nr:hypothetical protein NE237_023796 [Protea cynaroides]